MIHTLVFDSQLLIECAAIQDTTQDVLSDEELHYYLSLEDLSSFDKSRFIK